MAAGGVQDSTTTPGNVYSAAAQSPGVIAPFFTPTVQYWSGSIQVWAEQWQLDANLIATMMQLESCGDPQAVSPAGASGLFQVMPFHFKGEEKMTDPETNARRGLGYLASCLDASPGRCTPGFGRLQRRDQPDWSG
jgi:soluble lytic murein transglycosylase-like protein